MQDIQTPLDKHLQQHSIIYKGTPGNVYNTGMDEYYIERDGYSVQPQVMDPNLGCAACQTNNPPAWCFNPSDPCYDSSIPIEPGFVTFTASIVFLVFIFNKFYTLNPKLR